MVTKFQHSGTRCDDSLVSLIATNDRENHKHTETESDGQSAPDDEQDQQFHRADSEHHVISWNWTEPKTGPDLESYQKSVPVTVVANEQTSIRKGFSTVISSAILSRGEAAFRVFAVRLREAIL